MNKKHTALVLTLAGLLLIIVPSVAAWLTPGDFLVRFGNWLTDYAPEPEKTQAANFAVFSSLVLGPLLTTVAYKLERPAASRLKVAGLGFLLTACSIVLYLVCRVMGLAT